MLDDVDRLMMAAMADYDQATPEKEVGERKWRHRIEGTFEYRWARYRQREYMREYRKGVRRRENERPS